MAGYGRKNKNERVAWKVDLRKAYDTVNWQFLEFMMRYLRFPEKFISWVMMRVSSAHFSVSINGELQGYFEGKRGLRQGDPLSSFLFTLVMEGLSKMLNGLSVKDGLYFHPKCHRIKLSHLCFADDLFLLYNGRNSFIQALQS
ncbi:hypothetical protein QQ045_011865 [Rhodiola kirilowii]